MTWNGETDGDGSEIRDLGLVGPVMATHSAQSGHEHELVALGTGDSQIRQLAKRAPARAATLAPSALLFCWYTAPVASP